MQNFRIFGCERAILRRFRLFLCTIYRLKSLQALRRTALFGVRWYFPKNKHFSERRIRGHLGAFSALGPFFAVRKMAFGTLFWLLRAEDCVAKIFAIRKFLRRQAWAHFGAQSCPSWTGKSVGCSRHLLTDQMDKTICPYRRTGDRTRSQGVNWSIDQEGSPCPPQERRLFVSDKKEKALLFEKSNRNSLFSGCLWSKICSFWGSGIRARIAKRSPIARSSCDKLAKPF